MNENHIKELLSLWMDDITHYSLNEMSDYDAWNLPSWTKIEWPCTPIQAIHIV